MGSYSGEDSTRIYLDVAVSKWPNSTLGLFDETDKTKLVEVWLKEDKIEKFYFHDLDIDLKDLVDEKITKFIKEFYENNDNDNLLQEVELVVSYDVRGHHDPGRYYGPPEDCYPEDWDEERTLNLVEFVFDIKNNIILNIPNQYFDKIYDAFQSEIEEQEFTLPQYDYDDGEY